MSLLALTNGLLCIAALAFPFSVAASNVVLGLALAVGLLSGIWWQGAKACWSDFRILSITFSAYFVLLLLGVLWSQDFAWGIHILGRHWFWLLLPILCFSLKDEKWCRYFLIALSTGLTLNLLYCVLQSFGYVHVTTDGSSADNATGHIGHIGFGTVYGTWAAWLLYMGWQTQGKVSWVYWIVASWAYLMVFSAQGRSGYVVATVLACAVLVKCFVGHAHLKKNLLVTAAVLLLFTTLLAVGPAKERLQGTWMLVSGQQQDAEGFWQKNAVAAASSRIEMWQTTLDIYMDNPVFGVGTGGLPSAVAMIKEEGRSASPFTFTHPHNQYLLALVRWGPTGLLLMLVLFFVWAREGWRLDWRASPTAPLVFLPALALVIHGLSSSSLEEHFSAILAVLLLGTGLSGNRDHNKQGGEK
ncbi:O-antigen ligase family protein [Mariprofundus sp. KV]|uniref:O-antigen ligase family protein n=1 Tax=Mariprofundus sp. KV TaxID=2608715 RepID=UPI00322085BE